MLAGVRLDLMCAMGEKSCPPSIRVPVTPAEKGVDWRRARPCLSSPLLRLMKEEL